MFLTLSPTYMGLAQAAYDFTVRYLRGEVPGMPPVKRRMYPTKQIAVAQMQIKLEQIKGIWFQAVTEACANPSKEQVLRAYAAQYSVMEGANELAALAIRTCGGQAMLRSLPLERIYRDSRCGSLMLPWTAELCLDRIGREAVWAISCAGFAICFASLMALKYAPSLPLVYLMVFTQGALGYGLTSVMGPVVVEIFQGRHYGSIFGTIMLAALAGGAAGPWATGLLYDFTGSYTAAFAISIAVSALSAFAIWQASPGKVRAVAGRLPQLQVGRSPGGASA
jgi:hypothetical protein